MWIHFLTVVLCFVYMYMYMYMYHFGVHFYLDILTFVPYLKYDLSPMVYLNS